MIIPTWLELPGGARYGDACKKYVRIGLWKACSKSQLLGFVASATLDPNNNTDIATIEVEDDGSPDHQ